MYKSILHTWWMTSITNNIIGRCAENMLTSETAEFTYDVCVALLLCIFVGWEGWSCYVLLIDRKCHNTKSACSSYLAYNVSYTRWTRVYAHMQVVYDLWLKPSRASVWVCVSLNELCSYVEVCVSVCPSQPDAMDVCPIGCRPIKAYPWRQEHVHTEICDVTYSIVHE